MNENPNESEARSQNRRILAHLQQGGSITGIEALTEFGCFRLPSRIWDLKQAGHNIVGKFIKTPSGKRVMQYSLIK
jgi:hypothetical protein